MKPQSGQVAVVAAVVGIVGEDHVAGVQVVLELLADRLDGELRAEELARQAFGHGHRRPVGEPDADRQVLQRRHQVALRGARHHAAHLAAQRLEAVPDGRQRDGVDGCQG